MDGIFKSVGLQKVIWEEWRRTRQERKRREWSRAEPLGTPMFRSLGEKKEGEEMQEKNQQQHQRETRDCGAAEAKRVPGGGGKEQLRLRLLKVHARLGWGMVTESENVTLTRAVSVSSKERQWTAMT